MNRKRKPQSPPSADAIARRADKGEDVSRFFTNRGKMMRPIQRVNVDFPAPMLEELGQDSRKAEHQPPGRYQNPHPSHP